MAICFLFAENSKSFDQLLDTWCPVEGNVKAFLPNTGEEVVLIPEWLRLKMICSNVQRLEDIGMETFLKWIRQAFRVSL